MSDVRGDGPGRPEELAAWRDAYAAGLPEPGASCPNDERLAALAVGEVSDDERTRLADHVVACPRCADSLRILGEVHRASGESASRHRRRSLENRRWLLAGAAAVLAVAVGLAWLELPRLRTDDGVVRGDATGELQAEPADGARLAAPPERLSWTIETETEVGDRSPSFRVILYDAESVPLWSSEPTETRSVELPRSIRQALPPGTYYWRIRTDNGLDRSATPLLRFEILR